MRQCLTILKTKIKLAHVKHIGSAETLAVQGAQVFGQAIQQAAAVVCLFFAALFKFDNMLADMPIGLHQQGVDRMGGLLPRAVQGVSDFLQQILIRRRWSWLPR